jgi:hypothetical protein
MAAAWSETVDAPDKGIRSTIMMDAARLLDRRA